MGSYPADAKQLAPMIQASPKPLLAPLAADLDVGLPGRTLADPQSSRLRRRTRPSSHGALYRQWDITPAQRDQERSQQLHKSVGEDRRDRTRARESVCRDCN